MLPSNNEKKMFNTLGKGGIRDFFRTPKQKTENPEISKQKKRKVLKSSQNGVKISKMEQKA